MGLQLRHCAPSPQLSMLSEREKEIIRGVAYGKVNKEIADELCIFLLFVMIDEDVFQFV